jgi:hypothetical protein
MHGAPSTAEISVRVNRRTIIIAVQVQLLL